MPPIVSFAFTLCCPDYPLGKTATNLLITELFNAVFAHAFVTHQRSIRWFDRRTNSYLNKHSWPFFVRLEQIITERLCTFNERND